ncbi:hypothetical protein EON80_30040, partial [bacterium]
MSASATSILNPVSASAISNPDEVLVRLDADMLPNGDFGRQSFEVTPKELRVFEGDKLTTLLPIADLKSARNEPLVSGGRLEVTLKSGAIIPVVTYSMNVAARFSEAARGVEQLIEGKPFSINLKVEKTRCEKCGRILPEKDGICPACINRNATLWRVAGYLKPYRGRAVALALVSIAATAINLVPPTIQGALINNVLEPRRDIGLLWQLVGLWLLALATAVVLQVTSARLTTYLAGHIATDLRAGVYRAVEFLQLQYFDKKQVGQITSRITQDTDRVWGFLAEGLPFLLSNALLIIGVLTLLLFTNWKLALAVMSPIPVVIFIGIYFWGRMTTLFQRVSS